MLTLVRTCHVLPKFLLYYNAKLYSNIGLRFNSLNIQMLSDHLHKQIFKTESLGTVNEETFQRVIQHLSQHKLSGLKTAPLPDVTFDLPPLHGNNIDEHFRQIALDQSGPYLQAANALSDCKLPPEPKQWQTEQGWTKYYHQNGTWESVVKPECEALIFDVEVLVTEGNYPTLATAVSPHHWYSWISPRVHCSSRGTDRCIVPGDLIPIHDDRLSHKLIIGHNVAYDRSFLMELYQIESSSCKFLDTMSLHIAVSGLTSSQRILYIAKTKGNLGTKKVRDMLENAHDHNLQWMKTSSLNNLQAVHQHYCSKTSPPISKELRNIFVTGHMTDIRENLQSLIKYCASDVQATHQVLQKVWPMFMDRFPHPVTFAGMLEMGSAYLPVNGNWFRYIAAADQAYDNCQLKLQHELMKLADQALELINNDSYKEDLWLWDLDWSLMRISANRLSQHAKKVCKVGKTPKFYHVPKWYAELCQTAAELETGTVLSGPSKITPLRRVTPKLLKLTWNGFPLHFDAEKGWGYLQPNDTQLWPQDEVSIELNKQEELAQDTENTAAFPLKQFLALVKHSGPRRITPVHGLEIASLEHVLDQKHAELERMTDESERIRLMRELRKAETDFKTQKKQLLKAGEDGSHDVGIFGTRFFLLPHKNGPGNRVGNPLAKDFLPKIDEGLLQSHAGETINETLKLNSTCSYWKNTRERIKEQMVVQLAQPPATVIGAPDYQEGMFLGAILPRIITAGTVTRRAVEKTWLTASNAYADRIGSELKAMVQCPPGYCFVGADVDSQELWIAALLGDAHFAGVHGCTAFGWMTLQGNKKDGTDLHSKTANLVGISRDQAKVFNYGRIYGAGQRFAQRLLQQFNPNLQEKEAKEKAVTMYEATKGKQIRRFRGQGDYERWYGGSESAMFNKLEAVATSALPQTPVLGAHISTALEPANVSEDFLTSRINWVVQSSAVDYLHLMLVAMRWLIDLHHINGRFSISIHDEVRYLVTQEDKHRAALALQITNLLTRCMFAYKLGMSDLPQSVAFFSAVDIDCCLRKEAHLDCQTPSNPEGLRRGYNIEPGESLTVETILQQTGGTLENSTDIRGKLLEYIDIS